MKIFDATGSGNGARVDGDNRIYTNSVVSGKLLHNSKDEKQAYMITTGGVTTTSTGEHSLIYIYNGTEEDFFFSDFFLSYNGGNTNFNRSSLVQFKGGATVPTANHTAYELANLNTGSANKSGLTAYIWNGTGVGMTHASPGGAAGAMYIKTQAVFKFEGFVLSPGQTVTMSMTAEEIGKVCITVNGYFDHGGSDS
jgi:hypothetical protein